jgi:hypothetical protein
LLSSALLDALGDGEAAGVPAGDGDVLLAAVVAGGAGGLGGSAELLPGGLASMLTVNMMAKARATAASVIRGLRCFTARPPPVG